MSDSPSPNNRSEFFSADEETPAREQPVRDDKVSNDRPFTSSTKENRTHSREHSRDHSRIWNKRLSEISNPNTGEDYWEIEQAIRLLQEALPRLSGTGPASPILPPPGEDRFSYSAAHGASHSASYKGFPRHSRAGVNGYGEYQQRKFRPYGSFTHQNPGISPCAEGYTDVIDETVPLIKPSFEEQSGKLMCSSYSKTQIMTLVSMLLLEITAFAAMSILAPFFPAIVEKRQLSPTINGVIFSTYGFVVVISSPLIGMLVPIITPRRLYLTGILLSAIANFSFGLVPLISSDFLFIAVSITLRGLAALGSTCFFIVIYAIVPILYPGDINTVTGMLETAVGLGMCIGPAIGGWLYSIAGYSLPFFTLGGFLFIVLPISCVLFPDADLPPLTGTVKVSKLLKNGMIIRAAVILVVTSACVSALYPTLQPHMNRIGVSGEWIGLVFLLMSAVYSLSSPLVGLAIDRWSCSYCMTSIGLILIAVSLILLGNSPILPTESHEILLKQDVISIVLLGLASSMCIVPTYAQMLQASFLEYDSSNLAVSSFIGGFWSSSYSLGEMIGPLGSGVLSEHLSFASTTSIAALLPLCVILFFVIEAIASCFSRNCIKSTKELKV